MSIELMTEVAKRANTDGYNISISYLSGGLESVSVTNHYGCNGFVIDNQSCDFGSNLGQFDQSDFDSKCNEIILNGIDAFVDKTKRVIS